jgi:hypothetical protein
MARDCDKTLSDLMSLVIIIMSLVWLLTGRTTTGPNLGIGNQYHEAQNTTGLVQSERGSGRGALWACGEGCLVIEGCFGD